MSAASWYRLVGSVSTIAHFATDRTTGAAGTYLGFACGRTYSVAEVTSASPVRSQRLCATCNHALEANGAEMRERAATATYPAVYP
jgi:hypothetical protein